MVAESSNSHVVPQDVEYQHAFEEGSTSEGSTDAYMTPDEGVEEDQNMSSRLSDEDVQHAMREAGELKAEGTEYFRGSQWANALQSYRRALVKLPPREFLLENKDKGKSRANKSQQSGSDDSNTSNTSMIDNDVSSSTPPQERCAKARAVLNGNIGACHVRLGEHKEAVAACSEALLDDPQYVKALHRRASSNDQLGTWSSLAAAEEDYKKLLLLLNPDSPLKSEIEQALIRVTPRRETAQKAEMGEMVDKLKGLGNSILGNFGLSTDNFKFEPNGQGGYSINFAQ